MSLQFAPERTIYSVSDLNAAIRGVFSRDFHDVWVAGEISGCRTATSGHTYFTLKDETGQLRCVLFKGTARWLKFRPQDGISVLARGSIDVYEQRGEYQLIVERLEPQGAGALQLAFDQLKRKLETEGLFAAERKRPLPKFPGRIGIVTSPAGAVIRDILHVLERRFRGLHVRLFPAQVQGEGAAEQVCRGIEYFSADGWAEVVILARGGGSIEDLWTFNEESVARAICACAVPVISAVGHETDFTIADFVADLRAPTPSAAAELVICTRDSLLEQIGVLEQRFLRDMRYQLLMRSRRFEQRGLERAATLIHRAINTRSQRVDDLDFRLRAVAHQMFAARLKQVESLKSRLQALDLRVKSARSHARLNAAESNLIQCTRASLWKSQHRFEALRAHLTQLSPLAVLGRGYAIVQRADGAVLRSAKETTPGERIAVLLGEGRVRATVNEVEAGEQLP